MFSMARAAKAALIACALDKHPERIIAHISGVTAFINRINDEIRSLQILTRYNSNHCSWLH
jgi:hypothetical protein